MKSRVLFTVLVLLPFVCVAVDQDKPPEPESIGVIYYVDSATQTLKRLPKEDYKKHRGGSFTITDNVVVSGAASTFHIAAGDKVSFVFKVFKDEEAGGVLLFRFTTDGKKREYELGKSHRRDFTPNRGIATNVSKIGDSSYKLVPEVPLGPGEYALTCCSTPTSNSPSSGVFTFSVGASGR
jgi:hypothetical protein